ncbi:MAG: phage holin family protein [Sphingomonadaceae bacterium]
MTRPQDVNKSDARRVPQDLPDDYETDNTADEPSLVEDVSALFEDGKTYIEAELAFQKSRAGFISDRLKRAGIIGLVAFGLLHLAAIAFTIGLVLSLSTLVGPWLATVIVVVAFGGLAGFLLTRLRGYFADIGSAFEDPQ